MIGRTELARLEKRVKTAIMRAESKEDTLVCVTEVFEARRMESLRQPIEIVAAPKTRGRVMITQYGLRLAAERRPYLKPHLAHIVESCRSSRRSRRLQAKRLKSVLKDLQVPRLEIVSIVLEAGTSCMPRKISQPAAIAC